MSEPQASEPEGTALFRPAGALLEVRGLDVRFPQAQGVVARARRTPPQALRALDGVDLSLETGGALGVVGESGCGKSTLALALAGLLAPTAGAIRFDGRELSPDRDSRTRRRIQLVFQDPASSLNPRLTVEQTLGELLRVHRLVPRPKVKERCLELLGLVDLPPAVLGSYPRHLSGGQRQRVAITRALAVEPDLLIADEAVASLDVSVQAAVVDLLVDLRERLGLTMIFISHDLTVVRRLCHRVAVMYLGRVVEEGSTEALFEAPAHPYTTALLASVPELGARRRLGDAAPVGEPPSPFAVPPGCRFHPRCPIATVRCASDDPFLEGRGDHRAACHYAWVRDGAGSTPGAVERAR